MEEKTKEEYQQMLRDKERIINCLKDDIRFLEGDNSRLLKVNKRQRRRIEEMEGEFLLLLAVIVVCTFIFIALSFVAIAG